MKKIHASIYINAPREKVWDTMLQDATYRVWTKTFNSGGSWFEGDWSEGSTIKFIGPNPETGTQGGMIARVKVSRKPEYVELEHYGMINDGVEDTTSEFVKKWTPAIEAYRFTEKDGGTQLDVETDTADEMEAEFNTMWPQALAVLKELAEK